MFLNLKNFLEHLLKEIYILRDFPIIFRAKATVQVYDKFVRYGLH